MTKPTPGLVSVIAPTYNYGHFLDEFVANLQQQTYSNWECLLVDDGSTDDSAEVVARHQSGDARIRYFQKINSGPAAARNLGLAQCSGEFIQFLDVDDLLEPDKLKLQADYLQQNPEMDIVYGEMRYFSKPEPQLPMRDWGTPNPRLESPSGSGAEVLPRLLKGNLFAINQPLFRSHLAGQVGVFNEAFRHVEDWDFWLRCALVGTRFQYVNQPGTLALVRYHAASISRDQRAMLRAELRLREGLSKSLAEPLLRESNQLSRASALANLGVREGLHGNRREGAGLLWQAARLGGRPKWYLLSLMLPLLGSGPGQKVMRRLKPELF